MQEEEWERKILCLTGERRIVLNDGNDISLSLLSGGRTEYVFELPYPDAGYGGGSLRLSPSEQYLVFAYFSGESEEAFLLFKVEAASLKLLYESGYLFGENADYCFSEDESLLLQSLRTGWRCEGGEETDENGNKFYELGAVNVLNIKAGTFDRHAVHVYPADVWEEDTAEDGAFQFSEINGRSMEIIMPWGRESVKFPPEGTICIAMKEGGRARGHGNGK